MLSHRKHPEIQRFPLESMDKVFLTGLSVETIVGIYPEERQRKQTVIVDLELASDTLPAAKSGDIADALDYHALSLALVEFIEKSRYGLIEAMAEDIASLVMTQYKVPAAYATLASAKAPCIGSL